MLRLSACLAVLAASALAGCGGQKSRPVAAGPDPERGRALIEQVGCGACHVIPGVAGANGQVGPPLATIGARAIIAGVLPNTPQNMMRWIQAPQSIVPGNAMPDMEINAHDARDIAAYLYTLR